MSKQAAPISRNARRHLWNNYLKPQLPGGLRFEFFSEIFGDHNLEFCWGYFQSLYAIFREINMPLHHLWRLHREILGIIEKNPLDQKYANKFKKVCLSEEEHKPEKYEKYKNKVKFIASKAKYTQLFQQLDHEEQNLTKKLKMESVKCDMVVPQLIHQMTTLQNKVTMYEFILSTTLLPLCFCKKYVEKPE
jgi:hypothetical protein